MHTTKEQTFQETIYSLLDFGSNLKYLRLLGSE